MKLAEISTSALRKAGVISAGEALEDGWMVVAQENLNSMIDLWATQRLAIYVIVQQQFNLTVSQQKYTVGTGGDFNIARPVFIQGASIITNNNPAQPLELPIDPVLTWQAWQALPVKAVESALPTKYYWEKSFPLAAIYFWPIPNVGNLQAKLYVPTAITGFTDTTTDYTFPPGYQEALIYNLAIRLCVEFGRSMPADLKELAMTAMKMIKRSNITLEEMLIDPALQKRGEIFNWRTGQ